MIDKESYKNWLEITPKIISPELRNFASLSELKNAAISIILIETLISSEDSFRQYSIIFGQRSNEVPKHKGQIAFPGGGKEIGEKLQDTAMRETHEEIGLDIDLNSTEWELLGEYPKDFVTISDYILTPFIFVYKPKNGITYKPDGYEIVEAFDVPITHLLDPKNSRIEKREWQGNIFDIHFFDYKDKTIWGVTGWVLQEFLDSLHFLKNN